MRDFSDFPVLNWSKQRLLIASGNQGKVREIGDLLQGKVESVVAATTFDCTEPEENADSFAGNALLKARYYSQHTGLVALADDSGLCVDALNGEPGIYSARWAGEHKDFSQAMAKIESLLLQQNAQNNKAHFICALVLCTPKGESLLFEGRVDGHLCFPGRGKRGFGYDPIFIPDGYDHTFAEMEPVKKHQMSHRARAFSLLSDALF